MNFNNRNIIQTRATWFINEYIETGRLFKVSFINVCILNVYGYNDNADSEIIESFNPKEIWNLLICIEDNKESNICWVFNAHILGYKWNASNSGGDLLKTIREMDKVKMINIDILLQKRAKIREVSEVNFLDLTIISDNLDLIRHEVIMDSDGPPSNNYCI